MTLKHLISDSMQRLLAPEPAWQPTPPEQWPDEGVRRLLRDIYRNDPARDPDTWWRT